MSNGVAEISGCKRQHVAPDGQIDRISSLPDSILANILSLLPTKDAVKTVLIRPFGNLWTSVFNLDFDACSYHECADYSEQDEVPRFETRLIDFVHRVLILHERSDIHRFRLRFEFGLTHVSEDSLDVTELKEEFLLAFKINTWIRFALRKKVKILVLDFKACGIFDPDRYHRLLDAVLRSDLITELKLVHCRVEPQEHIDMRSLKTLALNNVRISDETMIEIQAGCPMLENVSFIECYSLHKLAFISVNLKNVVIKRSWHGCSRLLISCPYVTSLNIWGTEDLYLYNASHVTDAALHFDSPLNCARGDYHKLKKLFMKLQHAKVLKISARTILIFAIWELRNISCPSSNWTCLVLKTMMTKWHLPGIASLLRNSPNLEMLDIHIQHGYVPFHHLDDPWLEQYELGGENFWNLQGHSFHCLTSHIKIIKIHGFTAESYAIQLVQFLLKSAAVLEKMVIETKQDVLCPDDENHSLSPGLQEFSQELLSFPRASEQAVILFVCEESSSKESGMMGFIEGCF